MVLECCYKAKVGHERESGPRKCVFLYAIIHTVRQLLTVPVLTGHLHILWVFMKSLFHESKT